MYKIEDVLISGRDGAFKRNDVVEVTTINETIKGRIARFTDNLLLDVSKDYNSKSKEVRVETIKDIKLIDTEDK